MHFILFFKDFSENVHKPINKKIIALGNYYLIFKTEGFYSD